MFKEVYSTPPFKRWYYRILAQQINLSLRVFSIFLLEAQSLDFLTINLISKGA